MKRVVLFPGNEGEVEIIDNIEIVLPKTPKRSEILYHDKKKADQKWVREPMPKNLNRETASNYVDYIEEEYRRRFEGLWMYVDGKKVWVPGSHYMYIQWSKIDIGYPEFRMVNRKFFLFWEACKVDPSCFGMCYLKNRRSGFSFMGSSETNNIATVTKERRFGILSKTGADAKIMFTDKVVKIFRNYPFFFQPIQDGSTNPRVELAFREPAKKITKNQKYVEKSEALDTSIDWKNTGSNSYDGEKLKLLVHDECYAPDTKILTEDFIFKPIKDLNVGDKVIVEGGKVVEIGRKVSGVTDMYKISQPYGKDYYVTRKHRLYLEQRVNSKWCKDDGIKIMTPEDYLSLSKSRARCTYAVKSEGVEGIDSGLIIPPYLLGLWLGDGRKGRFTITVNKEKDPELLEYLDRYCRFMNYDFDIYQSKDSVVTVYFTIKKSTDSGRYEVNDSLRRLNVLNNKHIPENYLKSSIESRLQLLAGLIDSDGYSDKKKNSITIGMSNKDMIDKIRFLALSCGLSCSEVKYSKSNFQTDSYRISISGKLFKIPILIERKSFEGYIPSYKSRRLKMDVEPVGKGEFIGITVKADNDDDRRLILEDFTISMNSAKWLKPNSIKKNWGVTKTCLMVGRKIIGKCMMGSTANKLDEGGKEYKDIFYDSNVGELDLNGRTKSGLWSLFIPAYENLEGFIDEYGRTVVETPEKPVMGIDGEWITVGSKEYLANIRDSLKNDTAALSEHKRQFPWTIEEAFRNEAKNAQFDVEKIYEQIDYNSAFDNLVITGDFEWKGGIRDSEVVWRPKKNGKFKVSWMPDKDNRNNVIKSGSKFKPGNTLKLVSGCDPYDHDTTTDGRRSNGSMHILHKFSMDGPSMQFVCEYINRPPKADIFYEDMIKACVFYGCQILVENNKVGILKYFERRGYYDFLMDRPESTHTSNSRNQKTKGIPSSGEAVIYAQAEALEAYICDYVGVNKETGEMGRCYFNSLLTDWSEFDITNRTKYDATVSSGIALLAAQKVVKAKKELKNIPTFVRRYDNTGRTSRLLNNGRQ